MVRIQHAWFVGCKEEFCPHQLQIQQARTKCQIRNLNHLNPGGISNVSQFSAPSKTCSLNPVLEKIRPPCHFACRNFCSSKVFCASTASGTPVTKGGCFSEVVNMDVLTAWFVNKPCGKVENFSSTFTWICYWSWLMWVRMGLCSGKYAWKKKTCIWSPSYSTGDWMPTTGDRPYQRE